MAAAFPQLEQAAALEVALAFADPGLLLAQLAHEQVQLAFYDVHLPLRQLLLPSPQLLLLKTLLLRSSQELLFPAAQLLEVGAGLRAGPGCWGRPGPRTVGSCGHQALY